MTPAEVAQRLGVELDFTPGINCLWTGEKLHTSMAVPCDGGYKVIDRSEPYYMFHEFAHIMLCDPSRIREPDYGTVWNPVSYNVHHSNGVYSQEEQWEEMAADTLACLMLLHCGYDGDCINEMMQSFYKPEVWERGMQHPKLLETFQLFIILIQ